MGDLPKYDRSYSGYGLMGMVINGVGTETYHRNAVFRSILRYGIRLKKFEILAMPV